MASEDLYPDLILISDDRGEYYTIPADALARWRVPEDLQSAAANLAGHDEVAGYASPSVRVAPFSARPGDQITGLNTKTQRYLTEAQDGEARVAGLLADYKSLLKEMRK